MKPHNRELVRTDHQSHGRIRTYFLSYKASMVLEAIELARTI